MVNIETYDEGDVVLHKQSIRFGDNARNVTINQVTAEKIENSFNRANAATNKPEEIRSLLKQLAEETAKFAEKFPAEKAEEVATDLETITEQSTSDKPVRKYWELSKKGMIEAAETVGAIGATAIGLVQKLGPLLGF